MAKPKFPRTMFKVTASFAIKEITLVGPAMAKGLWNKSETERYGYAADAKGNHHYLRPLFETREDAVAAIKKDLADQEARHKKAGENLAKRRANVEKLEA